MSRMTGRTYISGLGLLLAAAALMSACGGGGSGDTTGPPPGGADQVDSLVLDLDSVNVIVGDTVRLHAEARDAHGEVVPGIQLSFTSSDPAVATVSDDGLVTAVDLGIAEIEVGIAGAASRLESRVRPALSAALAARGRTKSKLIVIPKVVIRPGEQLIEPGAGLEYTATVSRGDGGPLRTYPTIKWSSSKTSVATIDIAGFATAVAEGDTRITASVLVGGTVLGHTSVTLHVAVCGGILRVAGWKLLADVEYIAGGTDPGGQATYRVDQSSTGGATLARSTDSGADSTVWTGAVTGMVGLNNSVTFPIDQGKTGITSEAKSGPIVVGPSALARLVVTKPAAGSHECTFNFRYSDNFTWQVTNNQGAPPIPRAGPTATAQHIGVTVGARPAQGPWVLGSLKEKVKLPGTTLVGPTGGPRSAFMPGTQIAVLMIPILAKTLDPHYGEASFVYELTATK